MCLVDPRRELERHARAARAVRVTSEKLGATWFGFNTRTFRPTTEPPDVPWGSPEYTYRGYRPVQALDRSLARAAVRAALIYTGCNAGAGRPDAQRR
jgi:hypothetical protein